MKPQSQGTGKFLTTNCRKGASGYPTSLLLCVESSTVLRKSPCQKDHRNTTDVASKTLQITVPYPSNLCSPRLALPTGKRRPPIGWVRTDLARGFREGKVQQNQNVRDGEIKNARGTLTTYTPALGNMEPIGAWARLEVVIHHQSTIQERTRQLVWLGSPSGQAKQKVK